MRASREHQPNSSRKKGALERRLMARERRREGIAVRPGWAHVTYGGAPGGSKEHRAAEIPGSPGSRDC